MKKKTKKVLVIVACILVVLAAGGYFAYTAVMNYIGDKAMEMLVSNQIEGMLERVPVLKKLDGLVVSYRIHLLKPDPAIYLYAAKNLGIKPEETLFVDDVLANVEGARKVGMEGYLFTTPEDFAEYLKKSGILCV